MVGDHMGIPPAVCFAFLEHQSKAELLFLQLFILFKLISINDCDICSVRFAESRFANIPAEKFKSEYLYNVRHAYGDVGGDANKRGRGYTPYSCQKLLTEPLPSSGQNHGCPYRTYSPDNLIALLQSLGVSDRDLLKGVREDVGKQRYHIACNRVFEAAHKNEIKKVSTGRPLIRLYLLY